MKLTSIAWIYNCLYPSVPKCLNVVKACLINIWTSKLIFTTNIYAESQFYFLQRCRLKSWMVSLLIINAFTISVFHSHFVSGHNYKLHTRQFSACKRPLYTYVSIHPLFWTQLKTLKDRLLFVAYWDQRV